jgi:hypothetical protein
MTGCSTPKRPLEVDGEDSQSENCRWNLKKQKNDVYPTSVSASRSSSRSSYGRASSVKILSDEVQKLFVGSEQRVVEPPQRNCQHLNFLFMTTV